MKTSMWQQHGFQPYRLTVLPDHFCRPLRRVHGDGVADSRLYRLGALNVFRAAGLYVHGYTGSGKGERTQSDHGYRDDGPRKRKHAAWIFRGDDLGRVGPHSRERAGDRHREIAPPQLESAHAPAADPALFCLCCARNGCRA